MARKLSDDETRQLRLRAQKLMPARRGRKDAAELVRAIVGVQAQDLPAAALSVRARTAGLTAADVERARVVDRSIVHTWAMRGTLHLLATDDLGWLLPLLGPVFQRADGRRRAELGLDEPTTERGVKALCELLAERGPQTRAELAGPLEKQGIPVEGQAIVHLITYAAMGGLVCHGPDRAGKPAYVLLADWVKLGAVLEPDLAAAELARRYLAAYGPAVPEDFAAWSGLGRAAARAAWQRLGGDLIQVQIGGRAAWLPAKHAAWPASDSAAVGVRLLPAFDTYLLGYATRDLTVEPAYARRIQPGGGIVRPALLADGRARGTWRSTRKRNQLAIVVESFGDLAPGMLGELEAEAQDVGRFLGLSATLRVAE